MVFISYTNEPSSDSQKKWYRKFSFGSKLSLKLKRNCELNKFVIG